MIGDYLNGQVHVLTVDGRELFGLLVGCDQTTNLILMNTEEIIKTEEGEIKESLGVYLVRGDSIMTVSEY